MELEQLKEKFKLTKGEQSFLQSYKQSSGIDQSDEKKSNVPVSFYNDVIDFNLFQYKPYFKLNSKENTEKSLYIADEVGVGKTFETCIIISEMLYSNKISLNDKILIICPNMLCRKWQEVLNHFFGLQSRIAKSTSDIQGISIMSFDALSSIPKDEIKDIALLIIDEAHNASGKRFEKLSSIRKNSNYAVLISATPLAGKQNDAKKQMELLFKNELASNFSFEKEGVYLNRTLKDELRDGNVTCHIENIEYDSENLSQYIDICNQIFQGRNTLRKFTGLNMIASSMAAAKAYINTLAKHDESKLQSFIDSSQNEDDDNDDDYFDESSSTNTTPPNAKKLKNDIDNLNRSNAEFKPEEDAKLNTLKQIIEANQTKVTGEEGGFYKKIIIFTNFNETAYYLEEHIEKSIVINGDTNESQKWANFNEFKDKNSDTDVLIITNVAAEGQDMDFCNTIVNYDLHYNPVVLAQRKGRIDRFKLRKNNIFVYNFCVKGIDPTPEQIMNYVNNSVAINPNSIYSVILRKLRNIKETTGIYYNVIDNVGKSTHYIDKNSANERAIALYNEHFELEGFNTTSAIVEFYDSNKEKSYAKINEFLKEKDIEVSANENNLIITTDKNNRDFLKYVYDGGTLSSHMIYNKGGR